MEGSEGLDKARKAYIPSINSFKVLSECPIILVLLFQIYKRFITVNIPMLVPLIVDVGLIIAMMFLICLLGHWFTCRSAENVYSHSRWQSSWCQSEDSKQGRLF